MTLTHFTDNSCFKLLLLISLLLNTSSAFSQEYQYFNNRYDISEIQYQDECYEILETNDGFILASSSVVIDSNVYWWEMKLSKIDVYGSIEFIHSIGEDSMNYVFPYIPRCFILKDTNFYAVGQRGIPSSSGALDQGLLICLDQNLDTLWSRKYGEQFEPYDTSYFFTSIQSIDHNCFIISGGWKPYGLRSHVYLLKTDSIGNQIWSKSYDYYDNYIEGYCVNQTFDHGFAIGCFAQIPGYPETVNPVIIKTDSLGNKEWAKNVGGPYMDFIPMISIAQDGNIIVGISYGDTMHTPTTPESRINILKLDNEGNIIWNKKYGKSQPNNYLRNISIQNDGTIISVGAVLKYNPVPDRVGWILKTDSNGDSLWYREYFNLSGQESRNYLYDVISTNDNGLIACGYVDPDPPDSGSIDTWVIKLDSIGCAYEGCDSTVGIIEQGSGEAGTQGSLEIWPNPASEQIHVRLNIEHGRFNRDLTLNIYDIYGRAVSAQIISSPMEGGGREGGWQGWTINTSFLSPGIYFIVLRNEGTVIGSAKFLVGGM